MTIYNPNPVESIVREADLDELPSGNTPLLVKRLAVRQIDYDAEVDKVMGVIDSKIIGIDAKLLETGYKPGLGKPKYTRLTNLKEFAAHRQVKSRIRQYYSAKEVKEAGERLISFHEKQVKEHITSDGFALGQYPDEITTGRTVFPIQDTFLPSTNSPYAKQMPWVDYQTMHRQCFEAATKNPIGKRIVKIVPQFVLGRSMVGRTQNKDKQAAWNSFWRLNRMRRRMKQGLREMLIFGEIFWRYF